MHFYCVRLRYTTLWKPLYFSFITDITFLVPRQFESWISASNIFHYYLLILILKSPLVNFFWHDNIFISFFVTRYINGIGATIVIFCDFFTFFGLDLAFFDICHSKNFWFFLFLLLSKLKCAWSISKSCYFGQRCLILNLWILVFLYASTFLRNCVIRIFE